MNTTYNDASPRAPSWLSREDTQFITQGLSITIASRDVRHVPSLSRALACRISPDGSQLIIILLRSQSIALLADIDRTGQVAAVITEPSSHRTLQLKGCDGQVDAIAEDDVEVVKQSHKHFAAEILPLGFSAEFADLLYGFTEGDLCRIVFTPTDVFQQTPGADAGTRLGPTT